ncbi:DUF4832 domain-containing protein [Flavobacterium sp.]|uniref:T9SS type A sorting domain-containing protein n=1 Tax=Flavobacterium sp. TaxID=239 RepID=UPI00260C9913|nr:DUF4832 domain-containing protein [Flavobacterium sp.]
MKKYITLLGLLLYVYASAQTTTISYTASSAVISNPERGFYKHTSTSSTLNQTELTNYRLNNNITLIYRNFKLDDFKTGPISAAYLSNMQSDFDKMRNAGIKCIIRFTYSNNTGDSPKDASKAIILGHISQLKPLFTLNADVIAAAQAGFIGTWGEWFYTDQEEFGGWGYNQTNLTATNLNNRKEVVNAFLAALPANRTIQLRKPAFKQDLYGTTALTSSQAFSQSNLARLGHHNDCFLATTDDNGTYDNVTTEYPYLAQETKYLPMGGETCDINAPRTDCTTALFEMNKFHWSYMNLDYYPDVINGFQTQNCFVDIQKKLGYRFELKTATLPTSVALGSTLLVTLKIVNQGFAAPFNQRKAYIVLKNLATNQVYPILMSTDPRLWLGPNEITITENLTLPANLTTGNYKMYLHLPDSAPTLAGRPDYAIRFANESVWENITGYNSLNHTLNVTTAALATVENAKLNMSIFPVPANDELNIELDNIDDYQITLYNAIGQKIKVAAVSKEFNKVSFNTSTLSDGLYFVDFTKGPVKDTRKFLVRH